VFWSILFCLGAGYILLSLANGRDQMLSDPERYLARVLGHDLDAAEYTDQLPGWEKAVDSWNNSSLPDALDEAVETCREFQRDGLLANSSSALQMFAIILAEASKIKEAEVQLKHLPLDSFETAFVRIFRAAYLTNAPAGRLLNTRHVLAEISPDWARDKLSLRLAQREGDRARAAQILSRMATRGRRLQNRVTALSLTDLALVGAGLLVMVRWLWRRRGDWPVSAGRAVALWDLPTGYGVLIRGGVAALALAVGIDLLPDRWWPATGFTTLLAALPVMWLARRHLLRPHGLGFGSMFGLSSESTAWGRLGAVCLVMMSLMILGETGLSALISQWQESPLSESVPEDFLFQPWHQVIVSSLDAVLWAPLMEEIVFRGFIYSTLRRYMGMIAAAGLSGAVFGVVHGYSLQGFLVICWSGFLWAIAFEKTRSLLPGMICHALSNTLAVITPILLYRM
jgi:membrane protease YdiL (CAAX protease family)